MKTEDPIRPSPRALYRGAAASRRKAAIRAVLAHYEPKPAEASAPAPEGLSAEELRLLDLVLGVRPGPNGVRRVTRNGYHAMREGVAHRTFKGLRDRGLVTLAEENGEVIATATSSGFAAVVKAHQGAPIPA